MNVSFVNDVGPIGSDSGVQDSALTQPKWSTANKSKWNTAVARDKAISSLGLLKSPENILQLGRKLGGGSYGAVYRGVLLKTGEAVAVKVVELPPKESDDYADIAMEVELLKRFSHHENVTQYFGAHCMATGADDWDDSAELWISMELCMFGSAGRLAQSICFPEGVEKPKNWVKIRKGIVKL